MGSYLFRFEACAKDVTLTLYKGDGGAWIVGKQVKDQWYSVCESQFFGYAKHAFDAEVAKIENETRYEVEGS